MQLGTGLFTCQRRPGDERSTAAIYGEMLDLARVADDADLDSVWVSEHHFEDDGYLSGVTPSLGALAAVTEEVEIGPCIALAPLYDPVRLAEDVATVDQLSGGRATLGLAIGSNPREFAAFGVPEDERVGRLEEAVAVCRAAWSEGALDYDADFHGIDPAVEVTPKPTDDVPIMLGGAAKPAVRRAARIGDAWCAPSSLSIEGLGKRVEDIHRVRETEGIDGDFQTYVIRHGFLGESREDAWDRMREGYLWLQRRYAEIFSGDSVTELDDDRKAELKRQAIFGTPDQVAEDLRAYGDALGADVHVVFRTYYPGIGTDRMATCIEALGDEVMPKLP